MCRSIELLILAIQITTRRIEFLNGNISIGISSVCLFQASQKGSKGISMSMNKSFGSFSHVVHHFQVCEIIPHLTTDMFQKNSKTQLSIIAFSSNKQQQQP